MPGMPRLRLHKSTIVLGSLLACALVLTMIPGRVVDYQPSFWKKFEHGWPYVYLRRRTEAPTTWTTSQGMTLTLAYQPVVLNRRDYASYLPAYGIPWLCGENWLLWQPQAEDGFRRWEFSFPIFLLDIAVGVLVVAGLVAAWELRRRRRPGLFSFALADMLWAVTVVSAVLGWGIYLNREYQRELSIAEKLDVESGLSIDEHVCIAPLWLQSLIGEKWMPEFIWRISTISVYALDVKTADQLSELPALPYLNKLVLSGSYGGGSHFPFAALRSIRQLETLLISDSPRLDEQDVTGLGQLAGLKKLAIPQKDAIPPDLLVGLESTLPHCQIIDADEDW
jgi:hypothetical protein